MSQHTKDLYAKLSALDDAVSRNNIPKDSKWALQVYKIKKLRLSSNSHKGKNTTIGIINKYSFTNSPKKSWEIFSESNLG